MDEEGIQETRQAVEAADFLATSLITHVETHAALARIRREGRIKNEDDYAKVLEHFQDDWRHYAKVNISSTLITMAGDLAEKHALRAYDAVHLASALVLRQNVPDEMSFSAWDEHLNEDATAEGFRRAH